MKKRIFSMLLACAMLFSVVPMLVIAGGAEEAQVTFTSSFYEETEADKITVDAGTSTVTYGGDWQVNFISAVSAGGATVVPLSHVNPLKDGGSWALTEASHDALITHPEWDAWYWGSPNGTGMLNLSDYGFTFGNMQCINMYSYTVKETGTFNLSAEIEKYLPAAYTYYFAIMINEKMVWPSYGATYNYTGSPHQSPIVDNDNAWYHVTPETTMQDINDALQTLRATATKGDRVEFCYRYGDSTTNYKLTKDSRAYALPKLTASTGDVKKIYYASVRENGKVFSNTPIDGSVYTLPEYPGTATFIGWDINQDGVVDYLPGAKLDISGRKADVLYVDAISVGVSRWAENLPSLDVDGNATSVGGWQTGVYSKADSTFLLFGTLNNDGILCVGSTPWGNTGGGLYRTSRTGLVAFSGCTESGPYTNEINYTAGYNGTLEFGLDRMGLKAEGGSADYIAYDFAVYKNGEKIWPTDGDWFRASSPEISNDRNAIYEAKDQFYTAGFPLSIEVEREDVISLRTQQANSNTWMLFPEPTVTYTALDESPVAIKADMTLDTDLDLNFYVQVINGREGVEVGMEYWTMKPTENMLMKGGKTLEGAFDESTRFYRFTYADLTAKQMADLIYVRPYSYVGDDVVYGGVTAFSIQKYAEGVIGQSDSLDKLLGALLTYGAQAQLLFGHNSETENLANTNVPEDLRSLTFSETLNNVYAQGEGDNRLTGASLLLGNRIGMKFVVNEVAGAETYVLEYAKDAAFTDAKTVAMVATKEGGQMKASFDLSFAELGDTFYVRAVIDGTNGATLTYSFETYFDRVQDDCDFGLYGALSALATFERGLADYR